MAATACTWPATRRPTIVLDVMLPIMDGWQVLRALRLQEGGADVPVIFLTARDEVQDRVKGLELGPTITW
jgi:two-component system copper resistance phosphate regulon response regulator CusR